MSGIYSYYCTLSLSIYVSISTSSASFSLQNIRKDLTSLKLYTIDVDEADEVCSISSDTHPHPCRVDWTLGSMPPSATAAAAST
jgi:hypothetical protein